MEREVIIRQVPNALLKTDLSIGQLIQGKVRDNYIVNDKRIIVATDRISAFDRVLGTLPFKGEILQTVSNFWFHQTEDIIANHIIDTPDPNVVIVKNCRPLPVEVIIRGYITGSLWRDYSGGKRAIYGLTLPEKLQKNQAFDEPILTPSTKAEMGEHDQPISPAEIVARELVKPTHWSQIEAVSKALFKRGQEIALSRGLILVDTKYEFGLVGDDLILIDEIHTPDSSRYWYRDSYDREEPVQLDKEYVRQWLIGQGFMGEGEIPVLPQDVMVEAVERYLAIYRIFLNQEPSPYQGDVHQRIIRNLRNYGMLKA
ncbi:MAG: phosphoribosylaminoimidazolesuccinocarboxamide synthase [Candidatus Delongbacteria bacterium]|nr:phosphoribosylaminoimidazolesuccinocarboxamide synthase [Candidatus Delongbacteria bacterium]